MDRYTMKELPALERPYEKLELYGEKALTNAELLAILLKTGTKEETSVQLAQRILSECMMENGEFSLKNVSLERLKEIKGIGRVKAIVLKAAFELATRIDSQTVIKPFLARTSRAGKYLVNLLNNEKQEKLVVLGLDSKGCLEKREIVFAGGLNYIKGIHPREIFRLPIETGCYAIIVAHNHPSGDPTPSEEDIEATQDIINWGELLDICVLDHIVVAKDKFVSIRGLKKNEWKKVNI